MEHLFSQHVGDVIVPTQLIASKEQEIPPISGAIGVGTWATQVEFTDIQVMAKDESGEILLTENFQQGTKDWRTLNGRWQVADGVYRQESTEIDVRSVVGDPSWSNYTLTLRARKLGGAEGMLILFGVQDSHDYYWWNLGGWGNTQHAIEKSVGGLKSIVGQSVPGFIPTNEWVDVRIEVEGRQIRCYLDDQLIHDVTDVHDPGTLFTVSSLNEATGELMVKVVNVADEDAVVNIQIEGVEGIASKGEVLVLTSDLLSDENTFQHMEKVAPVLYDIQPLDTSFLHRFPKYSVNVLRIQLE